MEKHIHDIPMYYILEKYQHFMRKIYVLEHANWDFESDELTNKGYQECVGFRGRFKPFNIVISSREKRNLETAKLLTESEPEVDARAGTDAKSKSSTKGESGQDSQRQARGHSGQIFSPQLFKKPHREAGEQLLSLIKETMRKLPKNGSALIVSHNQNMIAANKILHNQQYINEGERYHPLEGFMINEKMNFENFTLRNVN
jgi:broad specificity phosphatase PhoE